MSLITVIIALILDRLLREHHDLRDLGWFEHYSGWLSKRLPIGSPVLNIILILLLPLGLILLVQLALHDTLFNGPYFIFGVLVVIYCLGPACLASDIEAYLDARSLGDDEEAMHYAGVITERSASTVHDQQTSDVTRAILYVANQRIFSVLVWFVLLGPIGAVLFRFITQLARDDDNSPGQIQLAKKLHAWMAWLPARMLALGYAMMGNFESAVQAYRSRTPEPDLGLRNYDVLVTTGIGAIKDHAELDEVASIHAVRGLVMRSVLLWVTMLALLTMGGWLS
jgi:membrane protein required for beta-lactamase induction